MHLQEVISPKDAKQFLQFHVSHYKNAKNWIRPLDKDIEAVFDPKKNKAFRDKRARCKRWVLRDDENKIVGRIAAFINPKISFKGSFNVGGVGFFECTDNQEAANILFDVARTWLQENEMQAMDGPINFGERNAFWGLLVDGFNEEPVYQMNYNFPYYQALFENYGFRVFFKQYSYGLKFRPQRPDKYKERQAAIAKDPKYSFKHVDKKNLSKFADDFYEIYNKAWGGHKGVPGLKRPQAHAMMKKMKPVILDYLMWFGYYDDDPIAMYINLPELNQYFKHVNGKMNLWGKLKFLYHQKFGTNSKFYGIVFGVIPEFQGKGVEGAIIMAADDRIRQYPQWEDIEMTWIGDFNPKMMRVAENLGSSIIKTHHTYRYLFDREAEFERCPIIK